MKSTCRTCSLDISEGPHACMAFKGYVDTADALAPGVARSSITKVLTLWINWVFVCHKERFQLPVVLAPSQF